MDYRENYQTWLRDFAADEETMQDLGAIADNEKEIEDRFYRDLSFGTAGMRGVLAAGMNRMNVYTVRRATQGLANTLTDEQKQRGVVIGFDSRRYSDRFARETALVLCANGVRTYLFDALRPVALLSFAVRHLNAAAGIVITASHNPPQYNGYKVYAEDGAQLGPEAADAVTAAIYSLSFTDARTMSEEEAKASGLLKIIGNAEVDDDYIALVKTLSIRPEIAAEYGKDLKIVYTPIHGSGNVPVRRILSEMGMTNVSVVAEQEAPDPNFSTVKVPNPEEPAALAMAMKLADEVGADAVFGTDPDCDRLGVAVREKNGSFRVLSGNQIGCLMLYYILSSRKELGTLPANGAVVKSLVSTELATAICRDFGVEMFDTLTGFKFIGEKIQQFQDSGSHTFLFGFEESHGYLSSTFVRDKDGVNASLLIAEAAAWYASQGRTLCDVMDEIFARYGYYMEHGESTSLPGIDGLKVMKEIMARVRSNPPTEIAGVKVVRVQDCLNGTETDVATGKVTALDYPSSDVLMFKMENDQFVCVRPSGTEPKIKLYINVNDRDPEVAKTRMAEVTAEACKLLK